MQSDVRFELTEDFNEDFASVSDANTLSEVESIDTPAVDTKKKLSEKELDEFQREVDRSGVIYMSRVPPFMKPQKVKHLLGQFGDIGRIYLAAEGASGVLIK